MFTHLFRYRFLSLVRNKEVTFWNILFPLVLGTMFFFGFGRFVNEEETIDEISMAVVEVNESQTAIFSELMKQLEDSDSLFQFEVLAKENAETELEEGTVDAIIVLEETPSLIIKENGITSSIVKNFLDQYIRKQAMIEEAVLSGNVSNIEQIISEISQSQDVVNEKVLGKGNTNTYAQYFYALIAMCCLFASFQGAGCVNDIQANMNVLAARKGVSPVSKMTMVIPEALAAVSIQSITVTVLIFYLKYVLKLELGEKTGLMILTGILAGTFGISLGFLIGCIKKDFDTKIGILTAVSMLMCFFSGLMIVTIKGFLEQHAPFINRINPATLITECFYYLNAYDDYSKYITNMSILGILTIGCFGVSIMLLKGARYESI
ncbi:MAG: ABC transporter permease [Lachnospiraceae bacterium]|nr:ABC transporter permease [Lachnospiraceae bacterium]